MSTTEEQQLLESCRRGNAEALRQLVDAHYDPLYRFLRRLTTSTEAAADLTQEAFVRALARLGSFDGRARFSTWLQAIALNLWKDTRRRRPPEPLSLWDELPAAGAELHCEQEALARLQRHEVRRAIEKLPEAQRLAIMLFYVEEMSYKEIAHLCGCPVGTVGSWIHHGIRALRRSLSPPDTARRENRRRECTPTGNAHHAEGIE